MSCVAKMIGSVWLSVAVAMVLVCHPPELVVGGGQYGGVVDTGSVEDAVVQSYQGGLDIVRQELQQDSVRQEPQQPVVKGPVVQESTNASVGDGQLPTQDGCPDQYHWRCPGEDECRLLYYTLCDGQSDCSNGVDENKEMCKTRTCPTGQFRCDSGQCIKEYYICRGQSSNSYCADQSQTIGRVKCDDGCPDYWANEPADLFQCKMGECIYNATVCNGVSNCPDNSDEDPELCRAWGMDNGDLSTSETIIVFSDGSSELGYIVGISLGGSALLLVIVTITAFFCYRRCRHRCCVRNSNNMRYKSDASNVNVNAPRTVISSGEVDKMANRPPMPIPRLEDGSSSGYQSVLYTKDGYMMPSNSRSTASENNYTVHYSGNQSLTNPKRTFGNKAHQLPEESHLYAVAGPRSEDDYEPFVNESNDVGNTDSGIDDDREQQTRPTYIVMQGVPPKGLASTEN